jgi:hypothetical protein
MLALSSLYFFHAQELNLPSGGRQAGRQAGRQVSQIVSSLEILVEFLGDGGRWEKFSLRERERERERERDSAD